MNNSLPNRNSRLGRVLGRTLLRLCGWRIEGELPQLAKCVIVFAPHTSNWDFFYGMAAALALDLNANWLGKHTLFRLRPLNWILTKMGGVPVDREHPDGIIETLLDESLSREQFLIGITPEGTRSPVMHWKTGAWHIAYRAGIPILPGRIEYPEKTIRILAPFMVSGDTEHEMLRISSLYSAEQARHPHKFLPHRPHHSPPPDADGC